MPFLLTKAELENFPCQMALAKISIVYARSRYNQNGIEDGLDMAFFFGQKWSLISYKLHITCYFHAGTKFFGDERSKGPK